MGAITTFPTQAPAIATQGTFLAYAQIVANVNGVSGTFVAITGLSVTVVVPAGRRIRVSGHSLLTQRGAAGQAILSIWEGATRLNEDAFNAAQNELVTGNPSAILTPSAGAHTYNLSAGTTAGTVDVEAATVIPAFILVEDITNAALPYPPASVPVGVLAYAVVTANQGSITAGNPGTDLTGLSVNVVVPAGRVLRITARCAGQKTTVGQVNLRLFEGSTVLVEDFQQYDTVGGNYQHNIHYVVSPSAGSHTYKLTFGTDSAGTATMLAAPNYPAFILVEDITATPAPANSAPSSTLAHAQVVANQTGITTEVDLTGLSATVTVPAGRRIRITGHAVAVKDGTAGLLIGWIYRDGVKIGKFGDTNMAASGEVSWHSSYIDSPSAGAHTYKLTMRSFTTTGSMFADNSTDQGPAYILVEDITSVSTYAINPLSIVPGTFQRGDYTMPGSLTISTDGPGAASWAYDWNLTLIGGAGNNYTQLLMQNAPGALSATNLLWWWRADKAAKIMAWMGWDGTTTKTFMQLDWANGRIFLEDKPLCLRAYPDTNHHLKYVTTWAGQGLDGPILVGNSTTCLADINNWSLRTVSAGDVYIRSGLSAGAGAAFNGAVLMGQGKGYAAARFHWAGDGNDLHANWGSGLQFYVDVTNVKTFVIDHPLDPQQRYLVHAAVEGPEGGVFYRGQSQLVNGWVQVDLPSYFEALCAEEGRSVMLTCIADDPKDEWCPVLHATYPKNGKFYVGLGSGMVINDQRFWWEVKAVRKDVPPLLVEPLKKDVIVKGEGPYLYYKEKP